MAQLKTLSEIREKIYVKLQELTGSGQPLSNVYNYHTLEEEGFPYCSFEPLSLEQNIETNCSNNRTFIFSIILYQEFNTISREQALNILSDAFDKVIDKFDTRNPLDGEVLKAEPLTAFFQPLVDSKGKVYIANIEIKISILKQTV